jgi:hypothetical protein
MLTIERIWEVISNSDLTEGRGSQVVVARFFNRPIAINYAKDKGVMGTPAEVAEGEVLAIGGLKALEPTKYRVLGPVVPIYNDPTDIKRQQALSKLTEEDKRILGLS